MIYIKKLLNLVMKKGKKGVAIKNLTITLRGLKPIIPPSKIHQAFDKIAPLASFYKKKVAGKVYQIPWPIKTERSIFQAAKWIMLGVEGEKKGQKLHVKIGKQIVKTLKDKGVAIKLRKQFLDLIKENRSYMRFIRRKRKKKKKWIFQNRFTKGALSRELTLRDFRSKRLKLLKAKKLLRTKSKLRVNNKIKNKKTKKLNGVNKKTNTKSKTQRGKISR